MWQAATVNSAKRHAGRRWLDTARHPTRRDGAVLWALLLLPWVVALVLWRRHHYHHLDVGIVVAVIFGLAAVSLGLATLWITWAAYRDARRSGIPVNGLTMAQVADLLAVAVGTQWENEAAARRLNDPYPLPVSWDAADASLTDAWDSLVKLASSGAGWPPPPPPGTWAVDPVGLAGKGGKLAEVLARVPTGRLVVLGEPGAGKTMLMVRLVLDLLARRGPWQARPVLGLSGVLGPFHTRSTELAGRPAPDRPPCPRRRPVGRRGEVDPGLRATRFGADPANPGRAR
jgi:hypothetical protein